MNQQVAAEKMDFDVRGRITGNAPLGAAGWFRCGGCADLLFKPADLEDLQAFLRGLVSPTPHPATSKALAPSSPHPSPLSPTSGGEGGGVGGGRGGVPLTVLGVMSNTIIRDGGLRGVTIRLGKEFAGVEILENNQIRVGAMALDGTLAQAAAKAGIAGLEFFSGIPGTIGGALRMNAGCYGSETRDVLVQATAIDRAGNIHVLRPQDMGMAYRHTDTPEDYIFISAVFQGRAGDAEKIRAHMQEIKEKRGATQPIRERTGGSTFANPSAEDLERAGLPLDTKVWQLIDRAGCRGLMIGGAQMSEKHCNFMINTGSATAADLENLGEEVRRRVYEGSGIALRWEIKRMGEKQF